MEKATFGAGCFWGVEQRFRLIEGVVDAAVGYAGGHADDPTYHEVCSGSTGHAEVVEVSFDPAKVSYEALVKAFFKLHDPTTPNRQGPDVGSQYRSIILTHSPAQEATARKVLAAAQAGFSRQIVTEIAPAGRFWRAEAYHQQYLEKRGGGFCGI